jgi:hypothetical protein
MMQIVSISEDVAKEGQALIDLINSKEPSDTLEALFTPLQTNDPVEQFVRRT